MLDGHGRSASSAEEAARSSSPTAPPPSASTVLGGAAVFVGAGIAGYDLYQAGSLIALGGAVEGLAGAGIAVYASAAESGSS